MTIKVLKMVGQAMHPSTSLFSSPRSHASTIAKTPHSPLINLTGATFHSQFKHAQPIGCLEWTVLKPSVQSATILVSIVAQITMSFSWLYLLENQPAFSHLKNEEMTLFFISATFNAILQPLLGIMTFRHLHNKWNSRLISACSTSIAQFLMTTLIAVTTLSRLSSGTSYVNGIMALHAGHYANTFLCNLLHCLYYRSCNSNNAETVIDRHPNVPPTLASNSV